MSKNWNRRAPDDFKKCNQYSATYSSGYKGVFYHAAANANSITDNKVLEPFVARLKPKIREKVLLSQSNSVEKASIAVVRIQIIFLNMGVGCKSFQKY